MSERGRLFAQAELFRGLGEGSRSHGGRAIRSLPRRSLPRRLRAATDQGAPGASDG